MLAAALLGKHPFTSPINALKSAALPISRVIVFTTDGTNLYGSVRVEDIVAAIAAQGVDIDRSQIGLEAPITAVGQFDVPVKLHPEVEVTIKVWVVEA